MRPLKGSTLTSFDLSDDLLLPGAECNFESLLRLAQPLKQSTLLPRNALLHSCVTSLKIYGQYVSRFSLLTTQPLGLPHILGVSISSDARDLPPGDLLRSDFPFDGPGGGTLLLIPFVSSQKVLSYDIWE